MADIIPFPEGGGDGGSGLEARVGRLERDTAEIKATLAEIKVELQHGPKASDLTGLRVDLARLDGRVSQLPTTWTMFTAIITTVIATWGAGAAIVFTLLRSAR